MPSRKQRRRREKSFRHEYDYVLLDHEGNEVELDPEARRAEREAKERQRASTAKPSAGKRPARGGGRTTREPNPPSWERAFRRGGVMGALMLLAFIFLFKNAPIGIRLLWGIFYAGAFVPLTYFVDRTAYRSYQRRLAKRS
jgi:hypothetical protein